METAINKGIRRGQTEGRTQGRAERDIEIAQSMKKDGVDLLVIAKYTGLSPDEVERLKCPPLRSCQKSPAKTPTASFAAEHSVNGRTRAVGQSGVFSLPTFFGLHQGEIFCHSF